ncbi:hypothetical protein FQN60_002714 [Etheostoma spectabile]|uniref:Uncharacterized protein n=1 Tax=Etheostoma spectabile TaxID=54343 RepID=A0A5J5CK58_9PERO|nr:hypothetical protein FQN60_002714 [Etheostoma spectabile]
MKSLVALRKILLFQTGPTQIPGLACLRSSTSLATPSPMVRNGGMEQGPLSRLLFNSLGPHQPFQGLVLTSDSESEIFCDSVDTVPVPVKTNGFHNGHESLESSPVRSLQLEGGLEARQVGAGQGGEGAEDGKGPGPNRRSRASGREGGGDGSEGGADRLQDAQLQQQIMLALRRLRDDMRSVMERLEVEEKWWLFDVSGQTVVLFLVWPFVAQGLVYLLRRAQRKDPQEALEELVKGRGVLCHADSSELVSCAVLGLVGPISSGPQPEIPGSSDLSIQRKWRRDGENPGQDEGGDPFAQLTQDPQLIPEEPQHSHADLVNGLFSPFDPSPLSSFPPPPPP